MSELKPVIEQAMAQYAGAVLQSRALIDVRDGLKPSARQIFYCMDMCKYTHDKPIEPTASIIGDALKYFYIHGDSSCLGIIMRAAQPFSMRYPLVEVGGSYGNPISSGNWAAARYTKTKLSKIASYLFTDIKKDTIKDWRDNFSDTMQYPSVLPSKGFYNIVNGTSGIGIGMASSVPQYNIKELNEALIYLLNHPDCSFEEIYCAPDFATGGILYNEEQVKESMKVGTGFACKLRSVVEYDPKERCFIVTETPYGVYTETICEELNKIIEDEHNPGIERYNDLTNKTSLIKIYLNRSCTPERVLRYLYKNTSIQSHYGINFTMLDNGRFPKVFTWKEMLQSHLNHEREVYINGYNYDLNKINERIHILDGILICLADIDEVVRIIKQSNSTVEAAAGLKKKFVIDDLQVKAVLDMKLSKLAHLEVNKLVNEKTELEAEKERITAIINDEQLLKQEIEKGLREVADKFGDARRTKVINLAADSNDEVIEQKQLIISLSNFGNLYTSESSTLMTTKRGGVGNKIKMQKDEFIIESINDDNQGTLMLFSNKGRYYTYPLKDLSINTTISIFDLLKLQEDEKITNIISYNRAKDYKYIVFITKDGLIKKSLLEEYKAKKVTGAQGIKLKDGDNIISICFINNEPISILTSKSNFLIINTVDINCVGKIASGVKAITLNNDDFVVDAHIYGDCKEIVSVTKHGIISRTDKSEFSLSTRGTKGTKIQKLNSDDTLAGFVTINNENEIIVTSKLAAIKIPLSSIAKTARGAVGVKSMKIKENDYVIGILK